MRLLERFAYVDPKGFEWEAPVGSEIDGASIPQAAWSLVGGPFEGKYREASVIHDVACDLKDGHWQEVHEAFYWAMLASGVEPWQAKVMYAAVYHRGPRWPKQVKDRLGRLDKKGREEALRGVLEREPPGSRGEIVVTPDTAAVPKGTTPQGTSADETRYFNIWVHSPPSPLSDGDVEVLAQKIRQREQGPKGGLTLEEIRNFKPGG